MLSVVGVKLLSRNITLSMGNHAEWRRIAKKMRRKRIRQKIAKCNLSKRESEQSSEEYEKWLKEKNILEEFELAESERIHEEENEKWLRTELIAQQQWRQLQKKIAKARLEKAEQDLRIKKEWEEQQSKIKEAEDARKKIVEEQLRCHEELMKRIDEFMSGSGDLPQELMMGKETNPHKELCAFFSKTGACRFGDNCSRNHRKPGVSKVLLATNFYSNFSIEHSTPNECDSDVLLEYDDHETYLHFEDFFNDVLPEFQHFGNVVQFKVCCNFERHLRGNTYIEFSSVREAVIAYRKFHGRWYGGKQVSLTFCDLPSWKNAICGLFAAKRCPKGRSCNFLHVFRNPNNMFNNCESNQNPVPNESQRSRRSMKSRSRSKENRCNWRWSKSLSPENKDSRNRIDHRRSYSKSDRHISKRDRKETIRKRDDSKRRHLHSPSIPKERSKRKKKRSHSIHHKSKRKDDL